MANRYGGKPHKTGWERSASPWHKPAHHNLCEHMRAVHKLPPLLGSVQHMMDGDTYRYVRTKRGPRPKSTYRAARRAVRLRARRERKRMSLRIGL